MSAMGSKPQNLDTRGLEKCLLVWWITFSFNSHWWTGASMESCYLSYNVQAGGGGVHVYGMFSWRELGSLIPVEQRLGARGYLQVIMDQVHWWRGLLLAKIMCSATGIGSSHSASRSTAATLKYCDDPITERVERLWDATEKGIWTRKYLAIDWRHHLDLAERNRRTVAAPPSISDTSKLGCFSGQRRLNTILGRCS